MFFSVMDLAISFVLTCDACNNEVTFWNINKSTNGIFDINTRLIYGMRCIGKGPTATKVLCGLLNLHPPKIKINKYHQVLINSLHSVAECSMKKAVFEAVVHSEN